MERLSRRWLQWDLSRHLKPANSTDSTSVSPTIEEAPRSQAAPTAIAVHDEQGRIVVDIVGEDAIDLTTLQTPRYQSEDKLQDGFDDVPTESKPHVPVMSICIMIVGTRGDVQPFLGIAKRLQQDGHRVRLATHAVYREFVMEHGVEFYPLGGDPKELAAYMVKTGGHLIPVKYENLTQDMPRNIQMLEDILNTTWPAVSAPDPDALGKGVAGKPFQAQAIISNPVTYGHIHVAERLGVPLHIMFPQPWVPTVAFPHPLSNMAYNDKPQKRNYMSYKLVDLLMWQGTESMVNQFRTQVLGLRKIRKGDGGRDILLDLAIPHAFMWSPALVPKPADWGSIYDVIGTVLLKEAGSKYTPTPELEAFLGTDGGPIFVGFGSMVIEDPEKTTKMIIEAARLANVRVLVQSSWSDMAGGIDVPDNIFFLGNCPHDWLMPRVSAVVHHGGAGTTAAGLLAGKPTFIVPFFGDQPFWGRAVVKTGVGVEPCPISELSVEKLRTAFEQLQTEEIRARALALKEIMDKEDGVGEAVKCFYRHLPLKVMRCQVCETQLATKWSEKDKIRMCSECEYVVSSRAENDVRDIREYQCVNYTARGPESLLDGLSSGAGALLHELGSGVKDVFIKPAQGYREQGAAGAVIGLTKGVFQGLFIRPIQGVAVLADHIATGHYNNTRGADERKRGSIWLDNKTTAHTPDMKDDERVADKRKSDRAQVAIQLTADERERLTATFREIMATRAATTTTDDEEFRVITSSDQRDSIASSASDGSTSMTTQSTSSEAESLFPRADSARTIPKMNICLLTTGSWRENVEQFVAIGLRLQADGHRVRVATNENFRHRVTAAGLEFFPLAGHATTLGKFLLHQSEQQNQKRGLFGLSKGPNEFPEMDDLRALVFSLWPACVEVDPLAPGLQFRADAILAHPLLFGQSLVAERLGVPLHCVSTTPLSKTQAFPHLLSGGKPQFTSPYQYTPANAATFDAVDTLLWNRTRDLMGTFRSSLGLSGAASRRNALADWRIPHSYLWNASLLPKPSDWGSEISVEGFVELHDHQDHDNVDEAATEATHASVQSFIAESSTPVLYFGFMRGDWEPRRVEKLLQDIETAAGTVGARVIFQTVEENETIALHRSSCVLEVPSSTPLALLTPSVAGAVHWGDGSITATWLRAGVPSCVVARNATQRLWGQALTRASVGADCLELEMLSSSSNLVTAFQQLLSGPLGDNARRVSHTFSSELAIENTVLHFYDSLPLEGMGCDLDPTRVARVYDAERELKLSYEAHLVVQSLEGNAGGSGKHAYFKYKPLKYSQTHVPRYSLRQLDTLPRAKTRLAKTSRFTYEVAGQEPVTGLASLSLAKRGQLGRDMSMAVNVVEAPVHWTTPEVKHARVAEINAAYEKLLAHRV